MWKYQSSNSYPHIILHDCMVTHITQEQGDLLFEFADGFWLTDQNPMNPYGKVLRTGKSLLRFANFECDLFSCFSRKTHRFFGKPVLTTFHEMSLCDLQSGMDHLGRSFEIYDEFYATRSLFLQGCTWPNRSLELQMEIRCSDKRYCWNDIQTDREW